MNPCTPSKFVVFLPEHDAVFLNNCTNIPNGLLLKEGTSSTGCLGPSLVDVLHGKDAEAIDEVVPGLVLPFVSVWHGMFSRWFGSVAFVLKG